MALLLCGILLMPVQLLELSHARHHSVLLRLQISGDETFVVRYIHSVMKTPVYEHYRVMPDRRLLLTETVFSSYGAGLPEKNTYDFETTDKGFRIYNINKPFDFIVYRTAPEDTLADVTLLAKGEEYPFLAFSPERTPVRLKVKRTPAILYWIGEGSAWLMKEMNRSMTN